MSLCVERCRCGPLVRAGPRWVAEPPRCGPQGFHAQLVHVPARRLPSRAAPAASAAAASRRAHLPPGSTIGFPLRLWSKTKKGDGGVRGSTGGGGPAAVRSPPLASAPSARPAAAPRPTPRAGKKARVSEARSGPRANSLCVWGGSRGSTRRHATGSRTQLRLVSTGCACVSVRRLRGRGARTRPFVDATARRLLT